MSRDYAEMCGAKTRFESKKDAQTAINHIMRGHRRKRPKQLRSYPCPNCNGWHLTKGKP